MGPIGYPELIVIFLILILLAISVIIFIGLVWYFVFRRKRLNIIKKQTNDGRRDCKDRGIPEVEEVRR